MVHWCKQAPLDGAFLLAGSPRLLESKPLSFCEGFEKRGKGFHKRLKSMLIHPTGQVVFLWPPILVIAPQHKARLLLSFVPFLVDRFFQESSHG
jgi:hypothetical protein